MVEYLLNISDGSQIKGKFRLYEDINSKRYYGFALGVILVMISKQYSALGDDKNALIYMQSAKACLHPKAV